MRLFSRVLSLLLAVAVAACSHPVPPEAEAPVPTAANVYDLPSFDRFIAGRPTADEFRARYPAVRLVMPGDISTRELRNDRSRYFAELDDQQRIYDGKFQ